MLHTKTFSFLIGEIALSLFLLLLSHCMMASFLHTLVYENDGNILHTPKDITIKTIKTLFGNHKGTIFSFFRMHLMLLEE